MIPIKFRAWIKHPNGVKDIPGVMQFDAHKWASFKNLCEDDSEVILMEFTGLYDKEKIEIWEGDILEAFGEKSVIVKLVGAFWCKHLKEEAYGILHGDVLDKDNKMQFHKKLGNIYENPELLK